MDPDGVTAEGDFIGGHLVHLAAAGCVLNDVHREAAALGVELKEVRVTAAGGFGITTWQSTGIGYSVEVSSDAPQAGQPVSSGDRPEDVVDAAAPPGGHVGLPGG